MTRPAGFPRGKDSAEGGSVAVAKMALSGVEVGGGFWPSLAMRLRWMGLRRGRSLMISLPGRGFLTKASAGERDALAPGQTKHQSAPQKATRIRSGWICMMGSKAKAGQESGSHPPIMCIVPRLEGGCKPLAPVFTRVSKAHTVSKVSTRCFMKVSCFMFQFSGSFSCCPCRSCGLSSHSEGEGGRGRVDNLHNRPTFCLGGAPDVWSTVEWVRDLMLDQGKQELRR